MNNNIKSPFTILFVDDEEMARKYFEKSLREEFNVITAENIDLAQKILVEKHQEIAVVITDQRMPGGNGVKLLNYLNENHPQIIRLLTTGYSDLTEAIEAVNKGEIFRYIQKPWDFNLLKTELRQALNLFELRLERDKLVSEKIFIRQKMVKIDRLRLLILLARNVDFINQTDLSAVSFIKEFIKKSKANNNFNEWQIFELGNQEFLETLLSIDLLNIIKASIPAGQDYSLNSELDLAKIKSLFPNLEINSAAAIPSVKINDYAFSIIAKKLLAQINFFSASSANLEIKGSEANQNLQINFILKDVTIPQDNIFTAAPGNLKSFWHADLFICYLLVGHLGGKINFVSDENKKVIYKIELPLSSVPEVKSNQSSNDLFNDIILLAMLESY